MSQQTKPLILVPVYNTTIDKARRLLQSLRSQRLIDFNVLIAIDYCPESFKIYQDLLTSTQFPFSIALHLAQKRLKALGNIVKTLYSQGSSSISWVGIVDGDDYLCDSEAVADIDHTYQQGAHVVWSKFLWDGIASELSKPLPPKVNPYHYPWVSSHFKTFRYSLFLEIPISNFLDDSNSFFPRCYDHALMLPLLYYCYLAGLETGFVNKHLYYYDNKYSSIPHSEHTNGALEGSISNLLRKRGYKHL